MRESVFLFLLFCGTLFLPGCVETIVMDPGGKDLPVMVFCSLNPDLTVQTLYLCSMCSASPLRNTSR